MKKSRIVLAIVGILMLCGGLLAGLLLVKQNQKIAEKAAPATTMYITPGSQSKLPGDSFTFSVAMDTASNAVTGVDVRLNFDPNIIQITSLTQGGGVTNFNQVITNTYDNSSGKIAYAVFTLNSSQSVSGSNIQVLTVNAAIKQTATNGNYQINFDPASAASASQEGTNVITSMSPGTVVVGGLVADQNPTATPTRSPSPIPTGVPTATPLATIGATATPTIAVTNIPTDAPIAGALNSCGGTCGSNSNCQANYVCSNGYCRNPSCTDSQNCVCNPNPNGNSVSVNPTATPIAIPVTGTDWTTYLGIGLGLTTILGAIVLAI